MRIIYIAHNFDLLFRKHLIIMISVTEITTRHGTKNPTRLFLYGC